MRSSSHLRGESCSMGQNGEMGTQASGPGHKDLKFIPRLLSDNCRKLIESYHAIHGYAGHSVARRGSRVRRDERRSAPHLSPSLDHEKREKGQFKLRSDRERAAVARNIGERFFRLGRQVSLGQKKGRRFAARASPSHAWPPARSVALRTSYSPHY